MCAAPRWSPVLKAEAWSVLFSSLLGLTNGYFGSVPMILAPSRVSDEQKELTGENTYLPTRFTTCSSCNFSSIFTSGNIMTLSYGFGLTIGSGVAYILNLWLGPHLAHDPCIISNSTTSPLTNATLSSTPSSLIPTWIHYSLYGNLYWEYCIFPSTLVHGGILSNHCCLLSPSAWCVCMVKFAFVNPEAFGCLQLLDPNSIPQSVVRINEFVYTFTIGSWLLWFEQFLGYLLTNFRLPRSPPTKQALMNIYQVYKIPWR